MEKEAVCLSLRHQRFGIFKNADKSRFEVNADKSRISAQKRLINSATYRRIASHEVQTGLWLRDEVAIPFPLQRGMYLVPVSLAEQVEAGLKNRRIEREALVDMFCAEWGALIEDAREKLRDLFDPADYPDVEQVRSKFSMDWQFFELDIPGSLAQVSQELFDAEKERHAQLWDSALEECQKILRQSFAEIVDHAVEQLTPSPDGKRKRLFASMVTKWKTFIENFDARNIANDEELAALIRQAESIVSGVQIAELKDNDALRSRVRNEFAKVKEQMDNMFEVVPTRRIELD